MVWVKLLEYGPFAALAAMGILRRWRTEAAPLRGLVGLNSPT